MRKIKHILDQEEKLRGEYNALMSCAHKSTVSQWRGAIEVAEATGGFDIKTAS